MLGDDVNAVHVENMRLCTFILFSIDLYTCL